MDDNVATMWKGNQETNHGNWTDFLSPTNEVFVPDDRAWAGADNVVVEDEDGPGDAGWVHVAMCSDSPYLSTLFNSRFYSSREECYHSMHHLNLASNNMLFFFM